MLVMSPPGSLVDTTGTYLNKLGVDAAFFASLNYRLTRMWARAFMAHPSEPGGIIYHSRKNPELLNYAFFGRDFVQDHLVEIRQGMLEDHEDFGSVLDEYEIQLT
jgi:hypothetical protein